MISGRALFKTWWQQFIQWSMIGVVAGFFLYLAEQMMVLTANNDLKIGGVPLDQIGGTSPAGWFDQILPYGIILVLLYIGFIIAISTSATGADKVISVATKGGKIAGSWAGKQTLGRLLASEKGRGLMKKVEQVKLGVPTRQTLRGFWKASAGGKAKKLGAAIGGVIAAPITYPTQYAIRAGATVGLEDGAKQPQYIAKKQKELEDKYGKDFEGAAAAYSSILPIDWQGKIATGLYLAKTKGAKALKKLTGEQLQEVIRLTAKYNPAQLENVVKHVPELIDDREVGELVQKTMVPKGFKDEDVKGVIKLGIGAADAIRKAAFKKAAEAMKNTDVENMTLSTLKNKEFQEATIRFKTVSFIQKIGEEKGQEFLDLIHQRAEKLGAKQIAKSNATLLRSSITNPGFQAIFESLPGASETGDLDRLVKGVRGKILSDEDVEEIVRKIEGERKPRGRRRPRPPETGEEGAKKRKESDVG